MSAPSPQPNLFTQQKPPTPLPPAPTQKRHENQNAPIESSRSTVAEVSRSKNGVSPFFKENPIDNYFIDLAKRLKIQGTTVKKAILGSKTSKKWLREGLDDFRPNPALEEIYKNEYENKPHLKLPNGELGLGKGNANQSQPVELILSRAVEILAK